MGARAWQVGPRRVLVRDRRGHRLLAVERIHVLVAREGEAYALTPERDCLVDYTLTELEARLAAAWHGSSRTPCSDPSRRSCGHSIVRTDLRGNPWLPPGEGHFVHPLRVGAPWLQYGTPSIRDAKIALHDRVGLAALRG